MKKATSKRISCRKREEGISVIETAVVLPILLSMILVVAGFSVYSYQYSIANRNMLLVMEKAEGNEDLWVVDPYTSDKDKITYRTGLQELKYEASHLINGSSFATAVDYPGIGVSKFAFLPPGFCGYFVEGRELYCNDTFVCPDVSQAAAVMLESGDQSFIFCDLQSGSDITVPGDQLAMYLEFPPRRYIAGSCSKYPLCSIPEARNKQCSGDLAKSVCPLSKSVTCKQRNERPFLKLVNDYPTEVVADLKTNIPFFSTKTIKIKKLGGPKTVTAQGCLYSFQWEVTPWSGCQGVPVCSDSTGMRHRQATCQRTGCGQAERTVDSIFCDPNQMPPQSEACPIAALPPGHWQAGPWGQCSASCGDGIMRRNYTCIPSSAGCGCEQPPPVDDEQNCNNGPCPTYQCVSGACPSGQTGNVSKCHSFINGIDQGEGGNCLPACVDSCVPDGQCYYEASFRRGQLLYQYTLDSGVQGSCLESKLLDCWSIIGRIKDSNTATPMFLSCMMKSEQNFIDFTLDMFFFNSNKRTILFDQNCNVIKSANGYSLCGGIDVRLVSPISLSWDGEFKDHRAIVSFPLDPKNSHRKYTWKASSAYPLIVFDPKHEGKITEASQLFGDWTFGGKSSEKGAAVKWKNGFEALATLDKNKDGILSGEELAPLGLWFDANTNGISEIGEVVDIRQKGVKLINLKPERFEEERHLVIVDRGFEAEIEGKKKTGALVDWYGGEVLPLQEVSSSHLEIKSIEMGAKLDYPVIEKSEVAQSGSKVKSDLSAFMGSWEWKGDTAINSSLPNGYLNLTVKADGGIEGISIVVTPVVTEEGRRLTEIRAFALKGFSEKLVSGDLRIKFKVDGGESKGEDTYTTVMMNSLGELVGRSVSKAVNTGSGAMRVEYSWKAKKVQG